MKRVSYVISKLCLSCLLSFYIRLYGVIISSTLRIKSSSLHVYVIKNGRYYFKLYLETQGSILVYPEIVKKRK